MSARKPSARQSGRVSPSPARSAARRQDSKLVLASTSPARRALLQAAGISFEAVSPGVDEHVAAGTSPRAAARLLALRKAEAVAEREPAALVIGSDQTAELEGRLLRKPADRAAARRQLRALSGRTHALHTAVALVRRGAPAVRRVAVVSVRLTVRPLTHREIETYLDTGEWEGCAGSYRIEGRGIQLFERVRGDYHAILGLPMLRLLAMLRDARR